VRLPKNLMKELAAGSRKSGLSQQALMRKSMEVGLPRLLKALENAIAGSLNENQQAA
jgi:hypothetical protein